MASTASLIGHPARYDHAEKNLLFVLFGYAASVILTRWFLDLTGYPQIAGGDFHIAHVLWGGLLLFAAALILLIWRGRRVQWLASLLTGIGFGLFIDEVGKFITRSNDYFYPLAAPLIYAFFLLTVVVYRRVRNDRVDDQRADIHQVLDIFERSLDPDISVEENSQIKLRLRQIAGQPAQPEPARLAGNLLQFLEKENDQLKPTGSGLLDRWRERLEAIDARWFNPARLKIALILGFIFLGLRGLLVAVAALIFGMELTHPAGWERLTTSPWAGGTMFGVPRIMLMIAALVLEAGIGFLLFAGAVLLVTGRVRQGLRFGYWGLLFSLSFLYLPILYFQQFDVIATLLVQFALLMGVIRYRSRHLEPEPRENRSASASPRAIQEG